MFRLGLRKALFGAFFAIAFAGSAQSAQLITNGGFEAGATGWSSTDFVYFLPISDYGPCCSPTGVYPYGSRALFFGADDKVGGTVSQDVATLAGGIYKLSFVYGAISLPNLQQMSVDVLDITGPATSILLSPPEFGAFGTQNLNTMMVPYSFSFMATSALTRILFSDFSPSTISTDGVLDNVALNGPAPIPEPSTYALMIAGLGFVVFMARRRKKHGQAPALT
jgi:hypothetical protein